MSNVRLLSGLFAAVFASTAAAAAPAPVLGPQGYYVVVPMGPSHAALAAEGIDVALAGQTLPVGLVGLPYDGVDFMKLLAVTGDSGYTGYGVKWEVLAGSIPAGLTLNSNGTLSGTPTESGTSNFTLRATYKTKSGQSTYQVLAARVVIELASGTPPQAIVGQAYSYDLKPLLKESGDPAYTAAGVTWSVVSSSLPAGIALRSDGTISGTPTAGGTGTVVARASYRNGSGEQTYEVVSLAIHVGLGAGTPPQAIVGQAYSFDLKNLLTVNGDNAYNVSAVTWTALSDNLPAGLSLRSDGTIAGMPSAAGDGFITVRAAYRGVNNEQAYEVVTLAIKVALAAGTPPQAIVGQAFVYDLKSRLTVTGDNAYNGSGVTWSVVSSTLPAGLQLNTNGTIGGTPTTSGTGSVTARATYRNVTGDQVYQVVSLAIDVALAAGTPPQAIVGQAYSYDLKSLLTVSGDNAYNGSGVTWTVVSSSLTAGLQLNADGTIGGMPTAAGTGTVTARATYRGVNGQQSYQVVTLGISVALANGSPPQAITGQAYNYDLKPLLTVNGDPAYSGAGVTWTVLSSTLPPGLQLLSSGVISGTPTGSGTGNLVAQATYRGVNGQQTYQVVTLAINVTLAAATLPQARAGESYSYDVRQQLVVSGDSAYDGSGVTWTVVSTSLPPGLYLTGSGAIVGTPSASGTGAVTARATYRNVNGQQTYTVTALPAWTYSWTQTGWATPAACGPTTSTRSVSCLRDDGTTVADANCTSAKPASAQAATDYSTCSYNWQATGYTTPAACGSTTASRTVYCQRSDGTTVADGSCAAGSKPAATTATTDYSTCSYNWQATGYTTPAACGATTASRTVYCQRSDGTTVADGSCAAGSKPAATTGTTDYSACSYSWNYSGWSTPSACGAVTQTRSVWCQRSDGTTVADASCGGAKPAASASTTNYSSCTYSFSYSAYGSCSASCGGGTQTRSVSCIRSDGTAVANSSCGTPGATSQSCNTQSCYTYGWSTGGWSTPAACGAVTASRSVSCQRSDGASVSDAYCAGAKPSSTTATSDYSACGYSWSTSAWSTPAACGAVTQTRSASCIRSDGATVSGSYCGAAPATSQSSTNYSACSYSFSYTGWSGCSATCGGGTQTRSVSCIRSDGTAVGTSSCGTPDVTSQSCNTQVCPNLCVSNGSQYVWSKGSPIGCFSNSSCSVKATCR